MPRPAPAFALAWGVLLVSAGCITPTPPAYPGDYQLAHPPGHDSPSSSVSVTGIHQDLDLAGDADQVPANLTVTLKLDAEDAEEDITIDRSDLELVADVPGGSELVADNPDHTRAPDEMYVERDDDWVEAESLHLDAGDTAYVRARFDGLYPFARPEDEATGHHPVTMQLSAPEPDGNSTRLTLTDATNYTPRWERDSSDARLFMTTTGGVLGFGEGHGGVTFGTALGSQRQFANGLYLRGATDFQTGIVLEIPQYADVPVGTGELYIQLSAPVTVGYNLALPAVDLAAGAGWAASLAAGGTSEQFAFPHHAVAELAFSPRTERTYPYRTADFVSDFSIYVRFMHQLGHLGGSGEQPTGVLFSTGFAFHPAS